MKKTTARTLKIAVDASSLPTVAIEEIDQWENEGGQPASSYNFLQSMEPVKRGEVFEVKGGSFYTEEGKLYYEAEIEVITLP